MPMDEGQRSLWERIATFAIDDAEASFPFSARLARENAWSRAFAGRVVEEYRRFVFLACAAGHPVSPSDAVDQAWHLHLLYTESYWDELCGDVLGRPLHHGPTRGGAREALKFEDWYERTLESYRRLFDAEPPGDVWPAVGERFDPRARFVRVDARSHWIVPRPGVARGRVVAAAVGLALAVAALAGCGAAMPAVGGIDLARLTGPEFLGLFVPLTAWAIVASLVLRWLLGLRAARRAEPESGAVVDPELDESADSFKDATKLDPYALILLARGPRRESSATAALARLLDEGVLELDAAGTHVSDGPAAGARRLHPLEIAVAAAARGRRAWEVVREASRSAAARGLEDELRSLGLIHGGGGSLLLRMGPSALLGAVLALGIWRLDLGMQRGRPIGYLVLLCAALGVAVVVHLARRPWRTRRGAAVLAALGREKALAVSESPAPSEAMFPLAFALLGVAALPEAGAAAGLRRALTPPPGQGGCGAGVYGGASGCGGGGCGGGGCGGGGCGG
jgi:uncharacterized protein (TIGR04222 family)